MNNVTTNPKNATSDHAEVPDVRTVRRNKSQTLTGNRALNIEELFRNNTPSHMSTQKNLRDYLVKINAKEDAWFGNTNEESDYMSILKHQDEFKPQNKSFVTQKFPHGEYLKSYAGLVDKKSLNKF